MTIRLLVVCLSRPLAGWWLDRRRRAVDSTILADAVATPDTVTQLIAAVRRVGREVPGAAAQIAAVCSGHDYRRPGKPRIDWDDPAAKDALVSGLVNDARALVAALQAAELDEQAQSAVALLALADRPQGRRGPGHLHRRPDARHTRKSSEGRRDGYRAHVAAEPETGIITCEELTRASGAENSDPAVAERFLAAEPTPATPDPQPLPTAMPGSWSGMAIRPMAPGDLRDAIATAGHLAVIKPKPLQPAVVGGFTVDDFTVDRQAGTVGCPGGHARPISATGVATFGALCRTCPLRQQCTASKTGRKIVLHGHDLLRQARRDWAHDPGLQARYRRYRPNVERVISQLASRGGRRLKLRYLGTANNNAWLKRRTAALNLRNLIGRGLTRRDGSWALATT